MIVVAALAGALAGLLLALRARRVAAGPIAFWAVVLLVVLGVPGTVVATLFGPVAVRVVAIALPAAPARP